MNAAHRSITTALLFTLITVILGLPRDTRYDSGTRYPPVTARYQVSTANYYEPSYNTHYTTPRTKFPERQQMLHVIIGTERPRSDRIVQGHTNNFNYHDRRGFEDIPISSRPLRDRNSSPDKHLTGRRGSRPDLGEIDRKINVEDEYDCDDTESSTSQAYRRSPSQDSDSRRQHVVRSSLTTVKPCKTRTSTYPSSPQNITPLPLQRPPNNTTSSPPRPTNTVKALGDIVFPDGKLFPTFIPRRAKCRGSTFCESADGDYPKEYINKILKNNAGQFRGLFGEDVVNEVNFTQRIDVPDESPLCQAREQVVFPKTAQNQEEKWLFIVNQDQYKQGVRVEMCASEGPCMFSEAFPLGYKTSCKQKYIYRKLLCLNEAGDPISDSFKLPSCCSCYVKMDSVARMGLNTLPKNMSPARSSETSRRPSI